jgi:hypothetical protein
MSLKGKATSSGGDFELCPAGSLHGCLLGVVDLGTHWDSFQGQTERKVRRVLLVWEVEAEVEGKDTPQHLVIGRDYNVGLNDKGELVYGMKSALRLLLEGYHGKQFSEGQDIDPEALLGRPCLVHVTHERTKGTGKDIARVKGISKPIKGMTAYKPTRTKFSYAADSQDASPPSDAWLPRVYGETVEAVLKRCLEWGGTGRRSIHGTGPGSTSAEAAEEAAPF